MKKIITLILVLGWIHMSYANTANDSSSENGDKQNIVLYNNNHPLTHQSSNLNNPAFTVTEVSQNTSSPGSNQQQVVIGENQAPAFGMLLVLILGIILSWKNKIWSSYEYA